MEFDLAGLSARDRYKLLGGLVIPRPIALVTSRSPAGHDNAAPFSFFNVLAEEPPIVVLGLGVAASGGAKDTTNNIREVRRVRGQPGRRADRRGDEPLRHRLSARGQRDRGRGTRAAAVTSGSRSRASPRRRCISNAGA